jgi:hypothetical protein
MSTDHQRLLEQILAESQATLRRAEATKTSSAAPRQTTHRDQMKVLSNLQKKTSEWASLGQLLTDIGRTGLEKVAFEELHGMDDHVEVIPLSGREDFDGGEKVMPVSPEAQPLSIDQANLSSLDHPARDSDGAPMPVRTHVLGKDPYHAAAHEVSEVGEGVTKESQIRVAKVFAKLSAGRRLSDPQGTRKICSRMGVGTPVDAIRMFKRSAARWGCSLDQVFRVLDIANPSRLDMLYKASEATIQSGDPSDQIEQCKKATMAIVKADQSLPTAAEVIEVTGCSALAANAAIQEVAEFIAAVNGEVMSSDAAAMGAAPPMPPAMGPADLGMPPQEAVMPPPPMPPPAPPMPMDPAAAGGAPPPMPMEDPAAMGAPPPGMQVQSSAAPLEDRIWGALMAMKLSGEDYGIGDFSDDPTNPNKHKPPTGDGHDQVAQSIPDHGSEVVDAVADSAMEMPQGDEGHLEGMFDNYRHRKTRYTISVDEDSSVSPESIAGLSYEEAQTKLLNITENADADAGGVPSPTPSKTSTAYRTPGLEDLRASLLGLAGS